VNIPSYKHAITVHHLQVVVTALTRSVVDIIFVRVNCSVFIDVSAMKGKDSLRLGIRNDFSFHTAFTLDGTHNRSFASQAASALALADTTDIGFVSFHVVPIATESIATLIKAATNQFEHTPCSFVGDTKFALKLLGRDSHTGLRHEVDRIKPKSKRGRGLVENRASGRVYVMSAILATVGFTAGDKVMLGVHCSAATACDTIRPAIIEQPV
jgi:hypothetical protein